MARSRHRLTKAITLKTIKPTLAWAQGAAYAFDFPANIARWTASGVATHTALSLVPGWTFSRASTGYALNNAGQLVAFASGAPRITDRGFLAEGARTNLCLQSQTFDNASWTATRAAVTANAATAPDGTLTAYKLYEDASAASTHLLLSTVNITVSSSTVYTTSIYAKSGERTWFQLQEGQGVTAAAYFDLANGAVGTVSGTGTPSATIEAIGGGWYRCILTWTSSGTAARVRVYLASGNGGATYDGDGTSGIYVWGAQLE